MTLTVLMLHHVEPAPLVPPPRFPDSYLAPDDFAGFLDLLAAGGYRTWTLGTAAAELRAGRRLPRKSVVLTFDDGCRCFAERALPELRRRAMTATVFAVSEELGKENRWDREAGERPERLLSASALRDVAAAGIEIGSHGRLHRDLTRCSEQELQDEVAGSKRELEAALGQPVLTFCYPHGRWDRRARAAVEAAGYFAAVTIEGHGAGAADDPSDLLALPRSFLTPGESRLERRLKASGRYRLWKRLPRLGLLAALRQKKKEKAFR
jgi:peptidoglycan/xylan/chitin deacetylase (PgdA/CDA1 family)